MSKEELTPEKLALLLGVTSKSPLYEEVLSVCYLILKDGDHYLRPSDCLYDRPLEEQILDIFGKKTLKKYKKLKKKGYTSYYGILRDDCDSMETVLCLDSFIVNNKEIFMDFSDGTW